MAIEIIPKQRIKEISWANITLYVFLAVFLIFLLSYFVLLFYEQKFTKELSEIEAALTRTPLEKDLEKDIISWQKRIEDFAFLLSKHSFPTKIFELLEQNTHPKVWLSGLKFRLEEGTIEISGFSDNFVTLGQQIMLFEKQEFVKNVNLSKVAIDKEGDITFDLQLTLDSKILK